MQVLRPFIVIHDEKTVEAFVCVCVPLCVEAGSGWISCSRGSSEIGSRPFQAAACLFSTAVGSVGRPHRGFLTSVIPKSTYAS